MTRSIFVGIGANLDHPDHGTPLQTCEKAVVALGAAGVGIVEQSPWYRSAPVPVSDQPWYINGVVAVETVLSPIDLLTVLHGIEETFGRVRTVANAARTLDLDLLDYQGTVKNTSSGLILPHPRMHERAFVLLPLVDVAPDWRHPVTGQPIADLVASLPSGQQTERLVSKG